MRISDWSSDGCSSDLLGIEVDTGQEVEAAEARLSAEGMSTTGVDDTTCCYAFKTETWVNDPDGASWEVYVKTGDAEQMAANADPDAAAGQCCSPADIRAAVAAGSSPSARSCLTAPRVRPALPPRCRLRPPAGG